MEYTAAQYLERIENKRLNSTPLYNREEMIDFAEKYAKQLTIPVVVDSLTDKEKIDYEIAQKRKESDDNMKSWLYAIFFGLVIIIIGFNILKSCSS